MSEKKSIVIKVKYPVAESRAGGVISGSQVVTEWNKKRILLALLGVILLLSSVYLIFSGDDAVSSGSAVANSSEPLVDRVESAESSPPVSVPQIQPVVTPVTVKPASRVNESKKVLNKSIAATTNKTIKSKVRLANKSVVRAVITQQINNKEPGREIGKAIAIDKEASWIYYFTELKQMKGQTVYHEWFKDNKRVSRYTLNIDADNWRTSSRKVLSASASGQWGVKLLDQNGNVLNEKSFKVTAN